MGILVDGNHITRVFVKDDRRGEGLGCIAMDMLEKRVFEGHPCAKVDSSLPETRFYERRGYVTAGRESYSFPEGAILVWKLMEKKR